jgi:hypothetical protein
MHTIGFNFETFEELAVTKQISALPISTSEPISAHGRVFGSPSTEVTNVGFVGI